MAAGGTEDKGQADFHSFLLTCGLKQKSAKRNMQALRVAQQT